MLTASGPRLKLFLLAAIMVVAVGHAGIIVKNVLNAACLSSARMWVSVRFSVSLLPTNVVGCRSPASPHHQKQHRERCNPSQFAGHCLAFRLPQAKRAFSWRYDDGVRCLRPGARPHAGKRTSR